MTASDEPISESQPKRSAPAGCLIVFGSIFFVMGLLASYAALVIPIRDYWSAQSWLQRPCVILTAELQEVRGDDNSTWKAAFTYRYQFGNREYVGSQDNAFPSSGARRNAQRRLDQLPVGTETICWVNPRQPQQALLDRSLHWFNAFAGLFFALIFCGAGAGVAYLGWRQRKANRQGANRKGANRQGANQTGVNRKGVTRGSAAGLAGRLNRLDAAAASDADGSLPASLTDANWSSGVAGAAAAPGQPSAEDLADQQAAIPQRLKPAHTRLAGLLALLAFGCIWNGVVGVFLWVWYADPPFGNLWGRVGFGLFLLPFIFVGLLLILGVIRSVLSLVNPRITIALSSGAVPLGETIDVAWEVAGGWSRLNKLSIYIVGQEWARYVQGTDTRTDQSPFACIEVVSTANFDEIPFGTCSVTIPDQAMHTFEQPNNKIQWMVRVHGHIAWWPNVEEDFPFRVTPPVA